MPTTNDKRIAKNTLFLYMRTLLTVVVNLYTVRIIWQVLGVDDYGIYNIVGGIVMMFAFLNNAMVASSQRFISFELGTGDEKKLNKVFSISIMVHALLAIVLFVLAETIGLWFVNTKLNIPEGRYYAANIVYQCSVVSFLLTVISVPYNSCIVAHEHMKAFGYFGVLEVLLKLTFVFLLIFIPGDKLIIYSLSIVCISVIMRLLYGIYCHRNFKECHFQREKDKSLIKDMFNFAGWSFIGNLGISFKDQGLNIILNLFFNVAVNAAKGIANNIGAVIGGFVQSFQMALNPQITKSYAAGDIPNMMRLVYAGCKYSAFLMMFIAIPLILASEPILHLWLDNVAPYTAGFMQLVLIVSLIDSMVGPITTSLQATGNIKKFQMLISIIMLANIPLAWIWLKFISNPYIVIYVCIITSTIAVITRLMLLHELIKFDYINFFQKVVFRILLSFSVSAVLCWMVYLSLPKTILYLIVFGVCSCIISSLSIFAMGMNRNEQIFAINFIKSKIRLK